MKSDAKKIKYLMYKYDLNQVEFAKKTGLSRGLINNIINGKKRIGPITAYKISLTFNLDMHEILDRNGIEGR